MFHNRLCLQSEPYPKMGMAFPILGEPLSDEMLFLSFWVSSYRIHRKYNAIVKIMGRK